MPSNSKFPSSVEIKRVIAAATRAGIDIGSIEVHPRKITIQSRQENAPKMTEYEIWKLSQAQDKQRVRYSVRETDALPKKPRR